MGHFKISDLRLIFENDDGSCSSSDHPRQNGTAILCEFCRRAAAHSPQAARTFAL